MSKRRIYSPEYKREAVELTRMEGVSINQIEADMSKNKPVSVKANGQVIGQFIELSGPNNQSLVSVLSSAEYLLKIDMANGELYDPRTVQFDALNCDGQGYVARSAIDASSTSQGFTAAQGRVIHSYQDPVASMAFYLPPTMQELLSVDVFSHRSGGGCTNNSSTIDGYKVFPNNPAITGVQNPPYATPITLGY